MLRGELAPAAGGHPDHDRHGELPAGHVRDRGGAVHDLVQGEQREVDGHDLDDPPHPTEGRTDPGADEGELRQRRVADPLRAELSEQPAGDGVRAPVLSDVLPHQKHALVPQQCLPQCLAHGVAIGRAGLDRTRAHGARSM